MVESITIAASGAAVVIGSVMTWGRVKPFGITPGQDPNEFILFGGLETHDGMITIVLGGLLIAISLLARYHTTPILRFGSLVLSAWSAGIAIANIDRFWPDSRLAADDAVYSPRPGIGLTLILIASVGATFVSLVWLIRSSRRVDSFSSQENRRADIGGSTP
jgi:hypothetical protein